MNLSPADIAFATYVFNYLDQKPRGTAVNYNIFASRYSGNKRSGVLVLREDDRFHVTRITAMVSLITPPELEDVLNAAQSPLFQPQHDDFLDFDELIRSVFENATNDGILLAQRLRELHANNIIEEIIVDIGRPIYILHTTDNGSLEKVFVNPEDLDNDIVMREDLDSILNRIGDRFYDNRAGVDDTLHRISRKLNRLGECIGLTIRIGRGLNILHHLIIPELESGKSILIAAPPGRGKTTFLRDCAKYLGERLRVEIIDTSNEIAGGGDIPVQRYIGNCRRMMVPDRKEQYNVMIEAVLNHNPQAIVIDEIGTVNEARSCNDISQRGVHILASVHSDSIEKIILSPVTRKLLGDTQAVILPGSNTASRKTVTERKDKSSFDFVVEIIKPGVIAVINTECIDQILKQEPYDVEIRWFKTIGENGNEPSIECIRTTRAPHATSLYDSATNPYDSANFDLDLDLESKNLPVVPDTSSSSRYPVTIRHPAKRGREVNREPAIQHERHQHWQQRLLQRVVWY